MNCLKPEQMINLNIWGRNLNIKIVADIFPGEEITELQNETFIRFMESKDEIFKQAFIRFKEYCLHNYSDKVDEKFENIFSYIIPKSIYIRREQGDKHIAGIFCKFRFDRENDLVAYVENECVTKIGTQDIIL